MNINIYEKPYRKWGIISQLDTNLLIGSFTLKYGEKIELYHKFSCYHSI